MKSLPIVLLSLLLCSSLTAIAGNKGPLDDLKILLNKRSQKLPPVEKRTIIGTWYNRHVDCTWSFEQIGSKYYEVVRCKDGSSGNDGHRISKVNSSTFRPIPSLSSGDHYVIQKNGDLAIRDREGLFDTFPKHGSLWPSVQTPKAYQPVVESSLTMGLSCYDVGYRYGNTATSSMKGRTVNPSWDFAVPERCRNDSSTQNGITAGTRAAW